MIGTIQCTLARELHPNQKRQLFRQVSDCCSVSGFSPAGHLYLHRDTERADKARRQSFLRLELAILVELRFEVLVEIPEEGRDGNESADQDAQVCEAFLAEAEVVDANEDDDEGLEPDVQEAVDEGDVEVDEKDHGLVEVERERPDEDHHGDRFPGHLLALELRLADELVVAGDLTETRRAADEDVVGARLG